MKLFQPDTVLAPQFFATLRRQGPTKRGEWQLIVAVLEDAVSCFQKCALATDSHSRRLFQEAYDWLMTSQGDCAVFDDDVPIFTFEYICEVLELDPDYIRGGLLQWRERRLAKACAAQVQALQKQAGEPLEPPFAYELSAGSAAVSGGAPA
jgi:hypothetical protein